jgi:hypothetical protein
MVGLMSLDPSHRLVIKGEDNTSPFFIQQVFSASSKSWPEDSPFFDAPR